MEGPAGDEGGDARAGAGGGLSEHLCNSDYVDVEEWRGLLIVRASSFHGLKVELSDRTIHSWGSVQG